MKRKRIALILSLALGALTALGISACAENPGQNGGEEPGGEDASHAHVYTAENVCSVCGDEWEYTEGFEFTLDEETDSYVVTGVGRATRISVLPYGYNGKFVTAIGKQAFYSTSLVSLVVPDSVTKIGAHAFQNCSGLSEIVIGNGVTEIEGYAFRNCASLRLVSVGTGLEKIGEHAFSASGLVRISMDVKEIGDNAFNGCLSLKEVTLSDSVTTIGSFAMKGCSALESLTLGRGLTSIGDSAFEACKSLTSVTIPEGVVQLGKSPFKNCTALERVVFEARDCTTARPYSGCFEGCDALAEVTFGAQVERIPAYLFYRCSGLTEVTLPESLVAIEESAFSGCGLTEITIPQGVEWIGAHAFYDCEFTRVVFANAAGWSCSPFESGAMATELSAEELSDPETAANYLAHTYDYYYWARS